MSDQFIQDSTA